ncbi:LANO_0H19306g1_1 [Lachancea nothofagi CBS 11611]|uniref:LANO_0H19306g1_1 n=1 Tax=Lachancea nothofagi CBS 11611 TaxID=1266666 RepID=A0A1G4KN54_9SACH|nr:LANO_0H19306g1_1 [Lachancea nothofagi CBS 11611]
MKFSTDRIAKYNRVDVDGTCSCVFVPNTRINNTDNKAIRIMINTERMLGDSNSIRKRKAFKFHAIKQSRYFEALKQLPSLVSSQQLTHDAIFREVLVEFKQVKQDLVSINDLVLKDITLELAQTSKIESQLKVSLRKLHHHYKKVYKKRVVNESAALSESESCTAIITEIQESLVALKQQSEVLAQKIAEKDNELPRKNRLLNDQVFNKRHYPLLFDAINKTAHPCGSASDEETEANGASPRVGATFVGDVGALKPLNASNEASDIEQLQHDAIQSQKLNNAKRQSIVVPMAACQIPNVMLTPQFRKVSPASISTCYEQATHVASKEQTGNLGDISNSLHDNLSIRK